jgi:hypothetical protein
MTKVSNMNKTNKINYSVFTQTGSKNKLSKSQNCQIRTIKEDDYVNLEAFKKNIITTHIPTF